MKVLVAMGVSGCGKSSIGELVAKHYGWPFIDGDHFHTEEVLFHSSHTMRNVC